MSQTVNPTLPPRVARMIEAFEGGWLAGDFDGMVLSWGPFQWNLGQGTLQPLLQRLVALAPMIVQQHLGTEIIAAIKVDRIIPFARMNILTPAGHARVEWQRKFALLAQEPVTQQVFSEAMRPYLDRGQRLAEATGLHTERAYALCCDVSVQNGAVRTDHVRTFQKRLADGVYAPGLPLLRPADPPEWERLKLLAHTVADLANPRWRENVLARKLTIALGRGVVHQRAYVMHEDFGIRYWDEARPGSLARWYET
jgi:hypothetical protein